MAGLLSAKAQSLVQGMTPLKPISSAAKRNSLCANFVIVYLQGGVGALYNKGFIGKEFCGEFPQARIPIGAKLGMLARNDSPSVLTS